LALVALIVCSPSPAAADQSPLPVVRQYLSALAAHRAGAVCATFAAPLRAFVVRWELGSRRGDCVDAVTRDHFHDSPGSSIKRIDIVRVQSVRTDAIGNVAVHLVLFFRFPCIDAVSYIPGCRPHFERRTDIIYLRREGGRFLIVKPGLIFENTANIAPPSLLGMLAPPGDDSTVHRPAAIGPPPVVCPSGGAVGENDARHDLERESNGAHVRGAPWLDITHVNVVRLGRQSLCVTITLAAPPRVDSSFFVDFEQQQGGDGVVDGFGLEVDGTGGLDPELRDPASRCPASFGLTGDQLQLIISPDAHTFRDDRALRVDVSTDSLQPGEPLLRHPLDATDTVGRSFGLRLPPVNGRGLARCWS
jgi:hypothetical protein